MKILSSWFWLEIRDASPFLGIDPVELGGAPFALLDAAMDVRAVN